MEIFAETERLMLRELVATDDVAMFKMDSNAEVHKYLGNDPVKNIEQIQDVIKMIRQQYIDNGIGRWTMIEKSSGNFIGWTGLKLMRTEINGHINYYDLGYRLDQKYWGKGFATESAKAALKYGFDNLKQDAIYAMTDINNHNSKKVLEKAGLKYIETFNYENEPHDWFKLSKEEWKCLK